MILNENEAKNLLNKILGYSKADSATALLVGSNIHNLRFARNSLTTNGFSDGLALTISSNIGRKSGSVTTNKFDEDSLKQAVRSSEEIARRSPDNKEFMTPLGKQEYLDALNYSADTEKLSSDERSGILSYIINESTSKNVTTAGYFEDSLTFNAVMNTVGLFAYNKYTLADYSATIRTNDGTGSARFEKNFVNINDLKQKELTDKAIKRSILSKEPVEIKPGRYKVILEPAAAADMLGICINYMNAREADEGRSYFSKTGGGNRIGESLANPNVTIFSYPSDINSPSIPFNKEGEPRNRVVWFEGGILKNLERSRYWAEKTGEPFIANPSNILMSGSEKSLDQMISETDNAILVTRFYYIRSVDQQSMLLTGLTRDGVFEVKDGKIIRPVKNFRFNESPMNVFQNLIEAGKPEKAAGAETGTMQIHVPPLKVGNFNFSSLSDAI
ncbi:MAG: TldD/PmbA family protein [Ignavibacteria bacterium]|nr:TldD/PmbA family protein [Ignavibacteria bacterium]